MNVARTPSAVLPLAGWVVQPSPGYEVNGIALQPNPADPLSPDATLLDAADLGLSERACVAAILHLNVASGRAGRIMQRMSSAELAAAALDGCQCPGDPYEARWLAYQRRVVQTFTAERSRMLAFESGDDAAWGALERQLERSAQRMLAQQGAGGAYAADKAAELAQQACVLILRAAYPCDVAFDAWSHTVLRNVVRAAKSRSRDILDRDPFVRSLDEWRECADGDEVGVASIANPAPLGGAPGASPDMLALIDAIQQMRSANRRAVLVYTYFLGLDDGEIAEKLGRNRDGVQVLRHRALRQLRSIVEQEEC